jgi:hypothetical protein
MINPKIRRNQNRNPPGGISKRLENLLDAAMMKKKIQIKLMPKKCKENQ